MQGRACKRGCPPCLQYCDDGLQVVDDVVCRVYEEAGGHDVKGGLVLGAAEHLHKIAGHHAQLASRWEQ